MLQTDLPAGFNPVWRYIPGSAQELALSAPSNHVLLTGGRGWGKTEIQIMRFRGRVGMGYGSHWRGVIFDRKYKNLDDLVVKSKRLFLPANDGAQFLSSNSDFKWRWPTGEELLFRVAETLDDYWSYHGHEYPFIGWNELTKYASGALYKKMLSVNRSGFDPAEHTPRTYVDEYGNPVDDPAEASKIIYHTDARNPNGAGNILAPIPLECVSTTNPYGAGHNWVKRDFIDVGEYGQVITKKFDIFNPKTRQDETIKRTQIAIFGTYRENPYLSPEYIAGLHEETDENILKAWVHGNWDIVAGGALDDKWRKHIHVVPRFAIPENWHINRGFDWGSSHPFYVGWFATSNGEEVTMPDGSKRSWPKNTLILFHEWYGTKEIGTNVGIKLSAVDIAKGIKKRENELLFNDWIEKRPLPGPADNQIRNVNEIETETIEKRMADQGIRWLPADKAKGTRKMGLELIRERLDATLRGEGPGLVFMSHCVASIATIPMLPRNEDDPDDVDSEAEDHPYDVLRYRVLQGHDRTAKVIKVSFG